MPLTVVDQGLLGQYAQYTGFKNRIINGAMMIDQRNAGASISNNTTGTQFSVDRWNIFGQQSAKFSAQQTTTVPTGFRNSLLLTSLSAYTPLSGDRFILRYKVEGYDMADLNWGTANAQTATFSFWVRSSLTGTFGGTLMNDTQARCFPFTYTINSANTWEQKTVTVVGDTTGTWETGNLTGLQIWFSLGAGSTYIAPSSGSWIAGNYTSPPGAQNFVSTSGATLYITGVQLEKGSTATSFDYRPYGTELALCQRYYEHSYDYGTAPSTNTYVGRAVASATAYSSTQFDVSSVIPFKVTKRATPSMTYWRQTGTLSVWTANGPAIGLAVTFNVATNTVSNFGFEAVTQATSGISGMTQYATYVILGQWAASSEL